MQYRSSTPEFDRTIEGFNSGEHLANARRQADARKLDDVLIVDVDCHHYETDNFAEILEYIEDPVIKQVAINTFAYKGASAVLMDQPGYQDVGGRVSRYLERKHEFDSEIGSSAGSRTDIAMDECAKRRLCLPVPDTDAVYGAAPASRSRGGDGAGL